jgi:hypothetical protein
LCYGKKEQDLPTVNLIRNVCIQLPWFKTTGKNNSTARNYYKLAQNILTKNSQILERVPLKRR